MAPGNARAIAATVFLLASNVLFAQEPVSAFAAATDAAFDLIQAQAAHRCTPTAITRAMRAALSDKLATVDTPNLSDETGLTPLDYAVLADDVPAIERFVAMGYRTDVRSAMHGGTLVYGAAQFGSRRALAWLLAHGAQVDARID